MNYSQILKELNIECIWVKTEEKHGAYLSDLGLVYLSDNMTETDLENYILHETWHVMRDDFLTKLSAPQLKIVQEAKANRYMLQHRCEEWLQSYDHPPDQIDINRFLDYFQLSRNFYDAAEEEFKKLLVEN